MNNPSLISAESVLIKQVELAAKRVLSNKPVLVHFAIGLVNSVLNFSNGQITEELLSILLIKILFWGVGGGGPLKMTLGPVHVKSNYSLSKWRAVKLTFFAPGELGENVRAFFL